MKKILVILLGLIFYMGAYSNGYFFGSDSQRLLVGYSFDGTMENIVVGDYRRNLKNSEGVLIKLVQKQPNAITSIKVKSLYSSNSLDYPYGVGRLENIKYLVDNRELKVGDTINFSGSSTEINIKVIGTYVGTSFAYYPLNADVSFVTSMLVGTSFEYSTYTGESGQNLYVSQAVFKTTLLRNLSVKSYGDMSFGRIIAGESGSSRTIVETFNPSKNLTYLVPSTVNLINEKGDTLVANISKEIQVGSMERLRIHLIGNIDVPLNASSGKYKGSFRVKFNFD